MIEQACFTPAGPAWCGVSGSLQMSCDSDKH